MKGKIKVTKFSISPKYNNIIKVTNIDEPFKKIVNITLFS